MKPVPKFWWDFDQPGESPIVVYSDYKGGERLAEFRFTDSAEAAIAHAEALIKGLIAGRVKRKPPGS